MSIANLNNPSNLMTNQDVNCDDLSCNNMNAENINFQNINGVSASISNITCDTITSKSMFISEVPPTVGTTSFLVRNPITGAIEINPNPGSGSIMGATSLGSGSAVYQGQAGSSLTFNSLTGTANSIIVGAPTAGEINFNIGTNVVTLIDSQTLINKTLTSPIISTISNTGTITVPTTTGTLALVSQIPTNANYVDLTTAQTIAGAKTFSTTPLAIGTVATDRVAITTSTVSITNSSGTANISLAGGEATAGAAIRATLGSIGLYTSNASNPQLRMNIPNTGISNDNSITNILGLNGTNLVFKNNIVDISSSQTLTNKTLTSPIISTISNTGTITIPTTTGTLALVSQIPTNANYVDLTSVQTITGVKTFPTGTSFNSNSILGLIIDSAGGVPGTSTKLFAGQSANRNVFLPDATGTLALVSQIPTNANYVDLTTNQSISGIKTFSTAPVISTISNGGTVTIPSGTDTLVNLNSVQTMTNKNLQDTTTYIVDQLDPTKRLKFAVQTISAPNTTTTFFTEQATDIDIIFPKVTTTLVGRNTTDTLTTKTIDTGSNTLLVTSGSLSATNINSVLNQPLLTTSTPQFDKLGIGTSTVNGSLQFANTVLSRKVVMYETANNDFQYFGMGIAGGVYRFNISTNTDHYIFYAGLSPTTAQEVFRISGSGFFTSNNGKYMQQQASSTTTSATPATILTIAVPTNSIITLECNINAYSTAGTNINKSLMRRITSRVTNVAGTVTVGGAVENYTNNDTGLSAPALSFLASGTNVLVQFAGVAGDTLSYTALAKVYYL